MVLSPCAYGPLVVAALMIHDLVSGNLSVKTVPGSVNPGQMAALDSCGATHPTSAICSCQDATVKRPGSF